MRVVILTEGGSSVGFGHVVRCSALYQAFVRIAGVVPEFLVQRYGRFDRSLMPAVYRTADWLTDRGAAVGKLKPADIVVIDSYRAPLSFYRAVQRRTQRLVSIDDNNRLAYPGGVVVNGGVHAARLGYAEYPGATYLLGSRFAALREAFWNVPPAPAHRDIRTALVSMGGSDVRRLTPVVVSFLRKVAPRTHIRVITAVSAAGEKRRAGYAGDGSAEFIVNPEVTQIVRCMRSADIAVSAGGQTVYELARVGVPVIVIPVARNQLNSVQEWSRLGFIANAGWYADPDLEGRLGRAWQTMDARSRAVRRRIGRAVVDGKGACRIVRSVLRRWKGG